MHFHLPKPLHGWREYFGEVGIIVIGVLIALGAEQVVEAVHLNAQTRHARAALHAEVAGGYLLSVERRAVHACLNAQIDGMEAAILKSGSTMAAVPTFQEDTGGAYVYRAPSRPWAESAWQNVRGEDVFANLSDETRQNLTAYYTQLTYMHQMNDEEDNVVGTVMALARPIPLDAMVKSSLIELLENERRRNDLMDLIASQMMQSAGALGDTPPARDAADMRAQSGTMIFCKSHGLPA